MTRRSIDQFSQDYSAQSAAPRPRQDHWTPGVDWDGRTGELRTGPLTSRPDTWDEILRSRGLDPEEVEVVEPVRFRSWDAHDGTQLHHYSLTLISRSSRQDREDIALVLSRVRRKKARPTVSNGDGGRAFVMCASDWQLGKGEGGGSIAAVDRIVDGIADARQRVRKMRPATAVIACLGDLVEGCSDHYPMQTFQTDADIREQERLVRRLLLLAVDELSPYCEQLVVAAVPGNHGERRRGGKAFTTFTDNADLSTVETVADICKANPGAYGHVSFALAGELTLTLEVAGVVLGLAHGHQRRRGDMSTWWAGQALGRRPVGDADILLTGHLHHLIVDESSGRTHIQVPAMDGGSQWFAESSGKSSPAGMLTLGIGTAYGARGWGDLWVTTHST